MLALMHTVTEELGRCELTFFERRPIDVARAAQQHEQYGSMLRACGAEVRCVTTSPGHADAVFIEDAAIVLDELAIATSPGAVSRRAESVNLRPVLAEYRPVAAIEGPATIDGGDVLRVGRALFVGRSARTNDAGIDALRRLATPLGYAVNAVAMRDCLHLKSACTALDETTVLVNPQWIDPSPFAGLAIVEIAAGEPGAANALRVGDTVCLSAAWPRTADLVARRFVVRTADISEFEKAEAAMTCLCVLLS